MDFFEVIGRRRSIRAYARTPVEEEKLRSVLDAAVVGPSAGGLQAFEIFVVRDPAMRRALASAALHQYFIAQAPVILIFCADPGRSSMKYRERGASLYSVQDATIACCHAMLAASANGLSTVWVGAFEEDAVADILRLPSLLRPVAILPVGYGAETPPPPARRPSAELVHFV